MQCALWLLGSEKKLSQRVPRLLGKFLFVRLDIDISFSQKMHREKASRRECEQEFFETQKEENGKVGIQGAVRYWL